MRVFVTGATGFVGSHLLRLLVEREQVVAALIRPGSDTWRIDDLEGRFTPIEGDLDTPDELATPLGRFAPEAVAHLAWEGVGNRYRNEAWQLERNVPRTVALVELAAGAGAESFTGLGSQAEYGPCDEAIGEDRPTRPTTLYGEAKVAACRESERLCRDHALRWSWMRLFSVYGPMDDPGWLIPFIILELLGGASPPLTEGVQRWDYLFVTDVAGAIASVLERSSASGLFNLGSGEPRSVRSIAEAIRDRVDPSRPLRFGEIPYRSDQIMHLEADPERLRRATGWRPRVSFDSGISQTLEWFGGHQARFLT